jgi:hypothetical protein
MVRNTKSSRTFYMSLHQDGLKMVFMESDKEVEIYVYLNNNKELFHLFNFYGDNPVIMKYDIRDLELIGLIF